MPLCRLFTNIAASALREGIETRLAHVIASTLNKSLERVAVVVTPGVYIFRNESTAPACSVNLGSTERFSKEENPTYTEPLIEAISKELNISRDRVILVYEDYEKFMVPSRKPDD